MAFEKLKKPGSVNLTFRMGKKRMLGRQELANSYIFFSVIIFDGSIGIIIQQTLSVCIVKKSGEGVTCDGAIENQVVQCRGKLTHTSGSEVCPVILNLN